MWYEDMVEGKQEAAFEKTLKELRLEYVDMYLLHWPINDVKGSWKVLEKYYEQGLIKNIGVSNFRPKHLKQLEVTANIDQRLIRLKSAIHCAGRDRKLLPGT